MATYPETPQRDEFLWKQAKKRVGFKLHLRTYLLVNAMLWILYFILNGFRFGSFTGASFPWPLIVMLSWGIGLVSHYLSVYTQSSEKAMVEREYEKLKNAR